ncbi:hypothetical protein [Arenibaculum sp.]|uniref:hypothetical protein n=1 Tax=Arenibaculum sp. TaxID=2865862 RepID=UPI002E106B29|nr:hypothetical protein [Arenibaculum sp.]
MPEVISTGPGDRAVQGGGALSRLARSLGRTLRRFSARFPTYAADAVADPRWLVMFVFARMLVARRLYVWFVRSTRESREEPAAPTVFADVDEAAVLGDLKREGLHRGLRLPDGLVGEIRAFALATPCYAGTTRDVSFLPEHHEEAELSCGRPILVGHYLDRVSDCPAIGALSRDPGLQRIAAGYLGRPPVPVATRLWWSFPSTPASEADLHQASQERLHFDLDDWGQLKFFFYLTDVDEGAGPHVYLRGSHAVRRLAHQFSPFVGLSTETVLRSYGRENLTVLTGPAGTGIVEDPFGFHTGTLARERRRLILELSFGLTGVLGRRRHGEMVSGFSLRPRRAPAG